MNDDNFWSSDIGIEAIKDEINACKEPKVEISHNGHSLENITNSYITVVNVVDPQACVVI